MNMLLNNPLQKLPEDLPPKGKSESKDYDDKILVGILMMIAILVALGLLFIDMTTPFAKSPASQTAKTELIYQLGPAHMI